MKDPADDPTGAWAEAIEHLDAAQRLMAEMSVHDPHADHTLEQVYRALFNSARRAIQVHWRHAYLEQANRQPKMRVDPNGHMKFLE